MRAQRELIRVVTFAHVGLHQVGGESDPAVAVLDQMGDGGVDPTVVVGGHGRRVETLDVRARRHDRFAGGAEPLEVGTGHRSGDRDDAVDGVPSRRRGEVGGAERIVAAVSGVEGLQQHDPATGRADLADRPAHSGRPSGSAPRLNARAGTPRPAFGACRSPR